MISVVEEISEVAGEVEAGTVKEISPGKANYENHAKVSYFILPAPYHEPKSCSL
jgi:hypothetical protein